MKRILLLFIVIFCTNICRAMHPEKRAIKRHFRIHPLRFVPVDQTRKVAFDVVSGESVRPRSCTPAQHFSNASKIEQTYYLLKAMDTIANTCEVPSHRVLSKMCLRFLADHCASPLFTTAYAKLAALGLNDPEVQASIRSFIEPDAEVIKVRLTPIASEAVDELFQPIGDYIKAALTVEKPDDEIVAEVTVSPNAPFRRNFSETAALCEAAKDRVLTAFDRTSR